MRRRKVIFGILALVACGILALVFWPKKEIPEPVYKGKKLSEWLDGSSWTPEVIEAFQAVGTNAIPCYMQWMRYEPSLFRKVEVYLTTRRKGPAGVTWTNDEIQKDYRRVRGMTALMQFLGERGAPAIPDLLALAKKRPGMLPYPGTTSPEQAIRLLGKMGRAGRTAYLSLVTDRDARVRTLALRECRVVSPQYYMTREVRAAFEQSRNDPDFQVRVAATNALKPYVPPAAKTTAQ